MPNILLIPTKTAKNILLISTKNAENILLISTYCVFERKHKLKLSPLKYSSEILINESFDGFFCLPAYVARLF